MGKKTKVSSPAHKPNILKKSTTDNSALKPPAVNVSPLIKLVRWTLLISGIVYGFTRHQFLAAREVNIREEENKQKQIRDAKIKEERELQSQKDIQMLADIFLGPQTE